MLLFRAQTETVFVTKSLLRDHLHVYESVYEYVYDSPYDSTYDLHVGQIGIQLFI
jgi:hypothetical protein